MKVFKKRGANVVKIETKAKSAHPAAVGTIEPSNRPNHSIGAQVWAPSRGGSGG